MAESLPELKANVDRFLEAAGRTDYERRTLVHLIFKGESSPAEVASGTKIPKNKTYEVLESLVEAGLVTRSGIGGKKRFKAVHPEVIFLLLIQKAHEMQLIQTQVLSRVVEAYEGVQAVGSSGTADSLVELTTGTASRASAFLAGLRGARSEILVADPDLAWMADGSGLWTQLGSSTPAIKIRVLVVKRPGRQGARAKRHAEKLQAAGVEVRQTELLKSAMIIVDRREAFLELSGPDGRVPDEGPSYVHVKSPALAGDADRLFNQAWEAAVGVDLL